MKKPSNHRTTLDGLDFTKMLTDRRAAIVTALGSKVDGLARTDRVSDEDQAQASHEEFVSLRLNGMEYQQLRQIQSALEKIRSGEFGYCEHCEERIAPKRLIAIPWAKFCICCQEQIGDRVSPEPDGFFSGGRFQEQAAS
jgi:DnaK suppressor protein